MTDDDAIKRGSAELSEKKYYLCFSHMNVIGKILVFTALLLAFGCNRTERYSDAETLATVGKKTLTLSDVRSLFPTGITPQDSVKLLESYVDVWVKKQLKIEQAELLFRESSDDIERMVEEYRSSLLSHKLDQYNVERRLDTLFTEDAIEGYYREHKGDFRLDRSIVKGRVVKLPVNYRQKKQLKELMASTVGGDRHKDLIEICNKSDLERHEFDSWVDLGEFMSVLPTDKQRNNEEMLATKGVIEVADGDQVYFVSITESLKAGDTAPFERVKDAIKRVMLNNRKQDIITSYSDSLYNANIQSGGAIVRPTN